mgnify:CR=1 FL=1
MRHAGGYARSGLPAEQSAGPTGPPRALPSPVSVPFAVQCSPRTESPSPAPVGHLLPALGITDYGALTRRGFCGSASKGPLELFVDGTPMTLARWPDASQSDVIVDAEQAGAAADEARFEQLLQRRAGSVKQRDDARARRVLAEARVSAASDRSAAAAAVSWIILACTANSMSKWERCPRRLAS